MSDDLVSRLRCDHPDQLTCEAADRIEELEDKLNWVIVERDETFALMLDRAQTAEAKLATCEKYRDAYDKMGRIGTEAYRDLEAKLAKAVEFAKIVERCGHGALWDLARTTLAELKGGEKNGD